MDEYYYSMSKCREQITKWQLEYLPTSHMQNRRLVSYCTWLAFLLLNVMSYRSWDARFS